MVHQFPESEESFKLRNPNVPESELKIYRAFQSLDDNWWVWHSVLWRDPKKDDNREADVVILHKFKGFFVMEIKGGEISLENNQFCSTSGSKKKKVKKNSKNSEEQGKKHKIKNPFGQAIKALHRIKDFYIEQAKTHPNCSNLLIKQNEKWDFPGAYSYGVIFPDFNFKQNMISDTYLYFSKDQIFDKSDLDAQITWRKTNNTSYSPLELFIHTLFDKHQIKNKITDDIRNFFIEIMNPTISSQLFYKEYLDDRNDLMENINEKQDYLIDSLIVKKDLAIEGSAGSGKTFLAIKKAMQLLEQRKRVLILCYNRKLRFFISDQLIRFEDSLDILNENEKLEDYIICLNVFEFAEWFASDLIDDKQKESLNYYIANYKREETAKMIEKLIAANGILDKYLFDAILIDEAQDIGKSFYSIFRKFLKKPYEAFYVFFDLAQALFNESFDLTTFGMDEKRDLIRLPQNLRNSVEIAKYILETLSIGKYKSLSGIHSLDVKHIKKSNVAEAYQEIIDEVAVNFFTKKIPSSHMVILSVHRLQTDVPSCFNGDHNKSQWAVFTDRGLNKRILVIFPKHPETFEELVAQNPGFDYYLEFSTIRSFKGLERDVVFILLNRHQLEYGDNRDVAENIRMQLYVGMSRAKFILYVLEYKK